MDNEVHTDETVFNTLVEARKALMTNKPQDRSETARRYQVTITELEKVMAYFDLFVVRQDFWPKSDE